MRQSYKDFYDEVKANGLHCSRVSSNGKINLSGWVHRFALEMIIPIRRYDNIAYTETLKEQATRYCTEYKDWIQSIDSKPQLYRSLLRDTRDQRESNLLSVMREDI